MLQALLLYIYVLVLICTENAYHANTGGTGRWEGVSSQIQEVLPQIQEVAPTTCVV